VGNDAVTTQFLLSDTTGLDASVAQAWVAGWINGGGSDFQVLQADGSFGGSSPTSVPFYAVSAVPTVSLSVATNGNDRLLFVVAASQPADLAIATSQQPIQYTQYPYANTPGVAAPGPFDVFEFGMQAQDDLSAVSGFGLNLSFSVTIGGVPQQFGMQPSVTRKAIGQAFTSFIANEAKSLPAATAFAALLYDGPIATGAPVPPMVDGQYFAIADPNDLLGALTGNYMGTTDNALATYWDATLETFFAVGNYLSINLSSNPLAPNIYSGQSSTQTNPSTQVASPAYTLSNGTDSYTLYMPLAAGATSPGLTGAQYVFQQAFGNLTPAGAANDAGLLQDCIWEALCRGVAPDGVSATTITNGESTTAWNDATKWYQAGTVCHLYAKFLHYATVDGTDSRAGGTPMMYGNATYGFSMDENPLGPYSGPNVPSKTVQNVPDGATITVTVGPWDLVAS
jgi:hypothetical protein